MKYHFISLIIIFALSLRVEASDKVLVMALPAEGNPPYSFAGEQVDKGVYKEIFARLFENTPYQLSHVYLSNPRIRNNFANESTDIECCPIAEWRRTEQDISLYTDTIFSSKDVLVFAKGKKRTIASLKGREVAVISGYG